MTVAGEMGLWRAGPGWWRSSLDAAAWRALGGRLRRRGLRGVVHPAAPSAPSFAPSAPPLAPWAARAREAGLLAAVCVPAEAVSPGALAALDIGAPLLLVLTPPPSRPLSVWRAVRAALAAWRSPTTRVALAPVAPCQLAGLRGDLRVRLVAGPGASPPPAPRWAPGCASCRLRPGCPGAGGAAPTDADVVPVAPLLSNQFDLIERPVDASGAGAVPLGDGAPVCPARRGLILIEGEAREVVALQEGPHLRRFDCDAGGWSPGAVRQVVEGLGQVYVDRSRKARLDDFAVDLQLLRRVHAPHAVGGGPEGGRPGRCPGLWRPAPSAPFAAEEAALLEIIAGLRGTVVDVGAGPVRYLDVLRAAMEAGRVRYVAVEPDPSALVQSGRALPRALLCRGAGEALPLGDAVADAVLFLRSYNHLRDVAAALAEAGRVLRPGGLLLLCDNVAFGLCRTPEQVRRARAIPPHATPFEHLRNANAHEAAQAVEAVPDAFALLRVVPVGPGTSNQWLVLARRLGGRPSG